LFNLKACEKNTARLNGGYSEDVFLSVTCLRAATRRQAQILAKRSFMDGQ
jgi:hypothetical protein